MSAVARVSESKKSDEQTASEIIPNCCSKRIVGLGPEEVGRCGRASGGWKREWNREGNAGEE